jgi:hypothetical protein
MHSLTALHFYFYPVNIFQHQLSTFFARNKSIAYPLEPANTCQSLNRYSMPVTRSRNGMHEMLSLDQTNTARFLFGEEEGATSPDVKNYLQMNATDDKFPILVRRDEYPGVVSFAHTLGPKPPLTATCSFPPLLQHLTWQPLNLLDLMAMGMAGARHLHANTALPKQACL